MQVKNALWVPYVRPSVSGPDLGQSVRNSPVGLGSHVFNSILNIASPRHKHLILALTGSIPTFTFPSFVKFFFAGTTTKTHGE